MNELERFLMEKKFPENVARELLKPIENTAVFNFDETGFRLAALVGSYPLLDINMAGLDSQDATVLQPKGRKSVKAPFALKDSTTEYFINDIEEGIAPKNIRALSISMDPYRIDIATHDSEDPMELLTISAFKYDSNSGFTSEQSLTYKEGERHSVELMEERRKTKEDKDIAIRRSVIGKYQGTDIAEISFIQSYKESNPIYDEIKSILNTVRGLIKISQTPKDIPDLDMTSELYLSIVEGFRLKLTDKIKNFVQKTTNNIDTDQAAIVIQDQLLQGLPMYDILQSFSRGIKNPDSIMKLILSAYEGIDPSVIYLLEGSIIKEADTWNVSKVRTTRNAEKLTKRWENKILKIAVTEGILWQHGLQYPFDKVIDFLPNYEAILQADIENLRRSD